MICGGHWSGVLSLSNMIAAKLRRVSAYICDRVMFANDTVDQNCEKLRTQVPADNLGTCDETITVLHKRKPEDVTLVETGWGGSARALYYLLEQKL